jgi:hypothetical protein
MVYERVEMELRPFHDGESGYSQNRVVVNATFVMRNQGQAAEKMQAIFPQDSLTKCVFQYYGPDTGMPSYSEYSIESDSFEISVDGWQVDTTTVTTPHPYKDTYRECETMNWTQFSVTFPVDQEVTILIRYAMTSQYVDVIQGLTYVLETGAGWYGPIERAYVIFKLPYQANDEMFLDQWTTKGYQKLYNEIFWSFQDIEPSARDNIQIGFVSPHIWRNIQTLRQILKQDPHRTDIWKDLADIYRDIAYWHGYNIRSDYYANLIAVTYEIGLATNPMSPGLHSEYAHYLLDDLGPVWDVASISDDYLQNILFHVRAALALNPSDSMALEVLSILQSSKYGLNFTPPPTIPPTVTPAVSETPIPSETPVPTQRSTKTPLVIEKIVTVIQTKIVTATSQSIAKTPSLVVTTTTSQTQDPAPTLTQVLGDSSLSNWLLWPFILAVGVLFGLFLPRKK